MMGKQKYATKKFNSFKSAESFRKKVGSNFKIKTDKNNKYCVRFKIDPTKYKPRDYNNDWSDKNLDGSFAYNGVTDDF